MLVQSVLILIKSSLKSLMMCSGTPSLLTYPGPSQCSTPVISPPESPINHPFMLFLRPTGSSYTSPPQATILTPLFCQLSNATWSPRPQPHAATTTIIPTIGTIIPTGNHEWHFFLSTGLFSSLTRLLLAILAQSSAMDERKSSQGVG